MLAKSSLDLRDGESVHVTATARWKRKKKLLGFTVFLTNKRFIFQNQQKKETIHRLELVNFNRIQVSPAKTSPAIKLLFNHTTKAGKNKELELIFEMSREERDALSKLVPKLALEAKENAKEEAKTQMSKEELMERDKTLRGIDNRAAVLAKSEELRSLYKDLVLKRKELTEAEFWAARKNSLADAAIPKMRLGVSSGLSSDLQSDDTGLTLRQDDIHRIFLEQPRALKAHQALVPHKLSEREFWTKYLRSHYYRQTGIGYKAQKEAEKLFGDFGPEEELPNTIKIRVDPSIDLCASDAVFDEPVAKRAKGLDKISALYNRHGFLVVHKDRDPMADEAARPEQHATKRAVDEEISSKERYEEDLRDSMELSDLSSAPPKTQKVLNIKSDPYFDQRQTNGPGSERSLRVFQASLQQWTAASTATVGLPEHDDALEVIREVTQSTTRLLAIANKSTKGRKHDVRASEDVPKEFEKTLRALFQEVSELARHFWSCLPVTTKKKKLKLERLRSPLDRAYEKLEKLKLTQRGATNTSLVPMTKPLMKTLEKIFEEYDVRGGSSSNATAADVGGWGMVHRSTEPAVPHTSLGTLRLVEQPDPDAGGHHHTARPSMMPSIMPSRVNIPHTTHNAPFASNLGLSNMHAATNYVQPYNQYSTPNIAPVQPFPQQHIPQQVLQHIPQQVLQQMPQQVLQQQGIPTLPGQLQSFPRMPHG